MNYENRLKQIRESEKQSHIEMYSNSELYKEGSWLRKPIKTVLDIIPLFNNYSELNVLDLGCGVGRNCIAIAQSFKNIPCKIDCVDILDLAIEKLYENAEEQGIATSINGIVETIENYPVGENKYDLVIAVSALEHIDSEQSFINKLTEINRGIRKNGIVCLVINSDVKETDKSTGKEIPAQFEVNLQTEKLQAILKEKFSDFEIMKTAVSEQQYDIPRGDIISDLKTKVVTFVARKK
jgi:2-polyprenyl-3-methyl-5-hydroxy-6-metoxy-1,4-benzoquinol methylase